MTEITLEDEKAKYEKAWSHTAYRNSSPGEVFVADFIQMECETNGTDGLVSEGLLADFGCGCGRASLLFHRMGLQVDCYDIAENCFDPEVAEVMAPYLRNMGFWSDEFKQVESFYDYGYCCDVMEHIPPERVDEVIKSIVSKCRRVFFSVCFENDHFGEHLEEHLHLTVQPFLWWRNKFLEYGNVIAAKDLFSNGVFLIESRDPNSA